MDLKSGFKTKGLLFFLIVALGTICSVVAQDNAEKNMQFVFNKLVEAYGNAKAAPQLQFMDATPKPETPAYYIKPIIKVDRHLYKLCQELGKDSLNALAVVLSHELAHYYYDHSFCTDFAFAIRKRNSDFAKTIKLVDKNQKIVFETQADDRGIFYAAIAGYNPFDVQPKIIDAIYNHYQLSEFNEGYPSKSERKEIAKNALVKAQQLYSIFEEALLAKENNDFDKALLLFEKVNSDFPSRENYNNMGVMKTLMALKLKPLSSEDYKFPKRFLYPLEIDNASRLQVNATRGTNAGQQKEMRELLKSAQKYFEKAISLDPNYSVVYINLACVFDLLNNPEAAIGKIKELSPNNQNNNDAKRILAIAYYHADNDRKAEEIWEELEK